jgi:type IV secretory pathway VirB6-like protein
MITKKEFKNECRSETYTGWSGHRVRKNAFYFGYKSGEINGKYFGGYKYMVAADYKDCSKADLLNLLYNWVTGKLETALPYYVKHRFAATDEERFKISLSI